MTFAHLPAVSRNPMIALVLAGGLLLPSAADADVYKWTSEDNEVQYTQMPPPPGISYVLIKSPEHPETTAARPAAATPGEPKSAAQSKQQADAEAQAAYEAEVARISLENCKIARNNLEQLNMGGHLRYRNEEGEYVTMKEEERQQRIDEANKQIEKFCKDESE